MSLPVLTDQAKKFALIALIMIEDNQDMYIVPVHGYLWPVNGPCFRVVDTLHQVTDMDEESTILPFLKIISHCTVKVCLNTSVAVSMTRLKLKILIQRRKLCMNSLKKFPSYSRLGEMLCLPVFVA